MLVTLSYDKKDWSSMPSCSWRYSIQCFYLPNDWPATITAATRRFSPLHFPYPVDMEINVRRTSQEIKQGWETCFRDEYCVFNHQYRPAYRVYMSKQYMNCFWMKRTTFCYPRPWAEAAWVGMCWIHTLVQVSWKGKFLTQCFHVWGSPGHTKQTLRSQKNIFGY